MILVELCVCLVMCLVMYFMIGCIVVSLFSLSSESFWETTTPKYLIMDILLWPVLVCGFIMAFIDKYLEDKE